MIKFRAALIICAVFMAGCSEKGEGLALPETGFQSAHLNYYDVSGKNTGLTQRKVVITPDILKRLNAIRFCGSGATTVPNYLALEYSNAGPRQIGFINSGGPEAPSYRVSYKFSGGDGEELRSVCSQKGQKALADIILEVTGETW